MATCYFCKKPIGRRATVRIYQGQTPRAAHFDCFIQWDEEDELHTLSQAHTAAWTPPAPEEIQ